MYKLIFKRFLDLIFSILGLFVLSPIFVMVAIVLFFANNGKPFFLQRRPGKNEIVFSIIKFRTMNEKKDSDGKLLPDGQRTTKVGHFVRKFSLDEIPQLINVIKGDMSLVGPRPLLISYVPLYNDEQRQRHNVKPGITGWAQVNGRNTVAWPQRFQYDVWYVQHLSFLLDCKILGLTFLKVIKSDGVLTPSSEGTEAFTGNK